VDQSIADAIDAGQSVADAVIEHKLSRLRKMPSIEGWLTRRGNAATDRWKILLHGLLGKTWATFDAGAIVDVVRALDRVDHAPGNELLNPWLYVVASAIIRMYDRSRAEELLIELREAVRTTGDTQRPLSRDEAGSAHGKARVSGRETRGPAGRGRQFADWLSFAGSPALSAGGTPRFLAGVSKLHARRRAPPSDGARQAVVADHALPVRFLVAEEHSVDGSQPGELTLTRLFGANQPGKLAIWQRRRSSGGRRRCQTHD
jgi:hypothetical protein